VRMSEELRFSGDVRPDVRICWALSYNGGDMTCSAVAKMCGMSIQRTRYQLARLVEAGVVLRNRDRSYSLQPFFHDTEFVSQLSERLHPLIEMVVPRMDWSYVDGVGGRRDIALVNSVRMFLAISDLKLREITLMPSPAGQNS